MITWTDVEREETRVQALREERRREAAEADAHTRDRLCYRTATAIVRRWEAAGFTSASLMDGLPRPERGHAADWHVVSRFSRRCGTCGLSAMARKAGDVCPGPGALNLVYQALQDGVPFGLVDGLPTAGAPLEAGDVVEKLARATCSPIVRREDRQAA
jgi:hypothetical protein